MHYHQEIIFVAMMFYMGGDYRNSRDSFCNFYTNYFVGAVLERYILIGVAVFCILKVAQ